MGSINPSKTLDVELLAHSRLIHPDTLKGTALDVSGDYALQVNLYHGYVEDTADTNPGAFLISGSPKSSGDDAWVLLIEYPVKGTDPDKVNINASEAAAQTDLTVDAVTGLASRDLIYLQDTNGGAPTGTTGALGSPETLSEWAYLRKAASTTATVRDGITNAKDSSDDLYNDATIASFLLDVTALSRVRVDFIHEGATGANCDVLAKGVRYIEDVTA